mmetsp:Transcript_47838/g.117331  ORF Transcript_47838/g.117331 Transcript_47838/m.117331 type:complete len:204 (-) Transcript_47838:207-818(-)
MLPVLTPNTSLIWPSGNADSSVVEFRRRGQATSRLRPAATPAPCRAETDGPEHTVNHIPPQTHTAHPPAPEPDSPLLQPAPGGAPTTDQTPREARTSGKTSASIPHRPSHSHCNTPETDAGATHGSGMSHPGCTTVPDRSKAQPCSQLPERSSADRRQPASSQRTPQRAQACTQCPPTSSRTASTSSPSSTSASCHSHRSAPH